MIEMIEMNGKEKMMCETSTHFQVLVVLEDKKNE